jgi:hypothetical protein
MKKFIVLVISHILAVAAGFAAGIYLLPVLIAPAAPSADDLAAVRGEPGFDARFERHLKGSDYLHWGEGDVYIRSNGIALAGRLAPGPDYKLYLSPEFVETEAEFLGLKDRMVRVGDVKTFENFMVPLPNGINPADYTAVIVWCEAFGQFITAARYR